MIHFSPAIGLGKKCDDTSDMNPLISAFCAVLWLGSTSVKAESWQPSSGHTQLSIWPGSVSDAHFGTDLEQTSVVTDRPVAGRPWISVTNVSRPTMTVYSPVGTNAGTAIIVFPGGGYQSLAMDLEGTEACDWLISKGITCVLLKYRVPNSGPVWDATCDCQVTPKQATALQDAQRTVGLVRFNAVAWRIDPHKIGVLGFSAGGHLAAAISTHYGKRQYTALDAADKVSCRPDFAIAVYPGHLSIADNSIALNSDISSYITAHTPPTFLVQDEDDNVDRVEDALSYYLGLKKAGVPAELHLYAQGGHAFGLRRTKFTVTAWPQLAESWLGTLGMITQ